jgi:hypothetical protein
LLDAASRDRARTFWATLPDTPGHSRTIELSHRTPSDAIRPVKYAFCKVGTPEGPRVMALGLEREESPKLVNQIVQLQQELERARRDLSEQALGDPLTGLGNRRWLLDRFESPVGDPEGGRPGAVPGPSRRA